MKLAYLQSLLTTCKYRCFEALKPGAQTTVKVKLQKAKGCQKVVGSKSKHREMETYETNPDFARVSFLRNTKSAALGVSGFEITKH